MTRRPVPVSVPLILIAGNTITAAGIIAAVRWALRRDHKAPAMTYIVGRWVARASCAQTGPDDAAWFPTSGEPSAAVRRMCAACPVSIPCLDHAVAHGEVGVWAGTTEKHRRRKLRAMRSCRECFGPMPHDAPPSKRFCDVCALRRARRVRADYDRAQRRDRTA